MSETKAETKEEDKLFNTEFWDGEIEYAKSNYTEEFRYIIRNDHLNIDGVEYNFVPVRTKNAGEFRRLRKEAGTINQETDWDSWKTNVCKRACILIDGMTPEAFEEGIFENLENVVTGWSIRAQEGFRRKLPRTPNDLPNGSQT